MKNEQLKIRAYELATGELACSTNEAKDKINVMKRAGEIYQWLKSTK